MDDKYYGFYTRDVFSLENLLYDAQKAHDDLKKGKVPPDEPRKKKAKIKRRYR